MNNKLLEIRNLSVEYYRAQKVIPAVSRVSLELGEGEILGVVGESGCGKTTLGLALLRLIPKNEGKIIEGEVLLEGADICRMSEGDIRTLRGRKISMIFQDPFTSFNPVLTIGNQIAETIYQHDDAKQLTADSVKKKISAVLEEVQIPQPGRVADSYPHQLSGGMLQRAMLAMAVAASPQILIADEPTTALDVTIQKEILELLLRLQKSLKLSIILITHNLGVIRKIANRVCIMYAGKIVEEAQTEELFHNPLHPYTRALLNSTPSLEKKTNRLPTIAGEVPQPGADECEFWPRCSAKTEFCSQQEPPWRKVGDSHKVRCEKS
ncbi:MAG: ABC transporter ATP-binding protein [Elusimicrobiota bacterium]